MVTYHIRINKTYLPVWRRRRGIVSSHHDRVVDARRGAALTAAIMCQHSVLVAHEKITAGPENGYRGLDRDCRPDRAGMRRNGRGEKSNVRYDGVQLLAMQKGNMTRIIISMHLHPSFGPSYIMRSRLSSNLERSLTELTIFGKFRYATGVNSEGPLPFDWHSVVVLPRKSLYGQSAGEK